MATILILGAGVMGTALAVPAADSGNEVLLAGTPVDRDAVARMKRPGGIHPKLDQPLPARVTVLDDAELTPERAAAADAIIVGVSSPGIPWAIERLTGLGLRRQPIAFVTKGLNRDGASLSTLAEALPGEMPFMDGFIGIGGPCIARELANRQPTACVYAATDRTRAEALAARMRTGYYRLSITDDVTGVEACAALKNFFAIGVSAMQTRYLDAGRGGSFKNPTAAAFTQAGLEMARLCERLGGRRDTAFDLAGIGDLHVTVGGGRNSKLGHGLGVGGTVSALMQNELAGETVEGIDTARALSAWLDGTDRLDRARFPLALAIMDAVLLDTPFVLDFTTLSVS